MDVRRLSLASLFAVLAPAAAGCSIVNMSPDDLVRNVRFQSANGKYVVVLRQHPELGDFETIRRDVLDARKSTGDPESTADVIAPTIEAALYRMESNPLLLSIARLKRETRLLVADDGQHLVATPRGVRGDESIRIYDPAGFLIQVPLTSVLTGNDLDWVRMTGEIEFALVPNAPLLELRLSAGGRRATVLVDLGTGMRVGDLTPVFPASRLVKLEVNGTPVDPSFATAAYPAVAFLARIEGVVEIDFAVDSAGRAERLTVRRPLPFGLSEAAKVAVRSWVAPPELRGSGFLTARVTFVRFADE